MAFYTDKKNVVVSDKPEQYDVKRRPGDKPSAPGIYKCQSCGFEDVINRECDTLPPCSECRNKTTTWKLLVKARAL